LIGRLSERLRFRLVFFRLDFIDHTLFPATAIGVANEGMKLIVRLLAEWHPESLHSQE
jgi:hypothetical protein